MFTRQFIITSLVLIWILPAAAIAEPETASVESAAVLVEDEQMALPAPDQSDGIEIAELEVTGRIDGAELAVTLDFEAVTKKKHRRMSLIQGDVVLDKTVGDGVLDYSLWQTAYYVSWARSGRHRVNAAFVAKSQVDADGLWRQSTLQIPSSRMRKIQLVSDRPDLEVQLPGAMRIQRRIEQEQLMITAILGANQPLVVRWKPQVELAGAKLVLSSQANTIVDVRAALLHMDTLFDFQITQGKIETLTFEIPAGLSITAIDGAHIRNWTITDPNESMRNLVVELSRPQEKNYRLRIGAETGIDTLPAEVEVPTIEPTGGIRASGHLVVGTDSALQLVVLQSTGLTQIDAAAFPRVQVDRPKDRIIPKGKAFFYTYAGSRCLLKLSVDDIVPSYDVSGRFVTTLKEDDLVVNAELELDVRDAPIRQLEIVVAPGMVVASLDGDHVEDYHLSDGSNGNRGTTVRTVFAKPLIGRTLIRLRLELGHGPLGQRQTIAALQVPGAKTHRGYVVVAAEAGIEIDDPEVENLRQVHTASVPLRVAQAQFAYRFRQSDWNLSLMAQRKPAGIRAEVFHLQSLGEAMAYGSAVMNYIITGSPVDELRFSLPESLENVEFVGSDVRRWTRQGDVWVVKLMRKVIGDYNLAVTYTQPHGLEKSIKLGALQCLDVQTQTGYVVVTSHLDLKLQMTPSENADAEGLLAITIDELPGDYRLLTSSPILAAYKYVTDPHVASMSVDPYRRSGLLPVILDIVAHRTRLAVGPDKRIESVTTVRYKVKNTTGQFLSLTMPTKATVWSVFSVDQRGRQETKTRLATSYDADSGRLLIPLSRKTNPNDPSTIELEYGQVHEVSSWWRRRLDLTAPRCEVPVTYAEWHITAPNEWAISAAGGNMQAQSRQKASVGLASVLKQVGWLWSRSFERWMNLAVIWMAGGVVLMSIILCVIFFRRWLPDLLLAILLVMFVWAGVGAALCGRMEKPAPATSLSFTQAINVDPDQAIRIGTELVPAWRQNLSIVNMVIVGAIIVAAVAVSILRRRLILPAAAAALVAAIYFAAKIPATWPVLKMLMTWTAPVALTAWCVFGALRRCHRRPPIPVQTTAMPIILLVATLSVVGGCTSAGPGATSPGQDVTVESVECRLLAGTDNMEVRYKLRISADAPSSFILLDESAVLVSSPQPAPHITVGTKDGSHTIEVDKANVYEVEATFLVPLPQAGPDHRRQFDLPLPMALTNNVSLVIPDTNVLVDSAQAVHLNRRVQTDQTLVEAKFAPGQPAVFKWQPKERQTWQEEVRFYASDAALAHVTSGLLEVFHAVRLQIAQGQVDMLKLHIPDGQTVTSVNAPDIGSWRFDPVTHEVEVRMTRPVTGVYEVMLVTQSASSSVPYQVHLKPLIVHEALEQHSLMGLAADVSVYVRLDEQPAAMNVRDYIRDSAKLIEKVPGLSVEQITQAFRFDSTDSVVSGQVLAVQSELRSRETARFNAEDDRLVYNSQWNIDITKAGRFDIVLQIPEGYDIDTLLAEEVSHWDESLEDGKRNVRVHFKRKLAGSIQLKLALSQPIAQMPEHLTVPRVILADVLKHTGQLMIGSEQGVRLSVASRQGVSEVNPAELGQAGQDLLAFRLLRPDWQLDLQTELVQPRVTVQSLHVAKVTDGLVRHDHYLRYKLFHAGAKSFELGLPADATGVTVTGPGIARREQLAPGNWRVELADKVFDRPYLLRLTYETQYDQTAGTVPLAPIRCQSVDLQQGYAVVFATDRMELSVDSMDASLRPAEARNIPKYFGAGNLSGAAMCYYSASSDSVLTVKAMRHAAAEQIGADVRRTELSTVITPGGQAIHRVTLILGVGTRRHLQVILPPNGVIWSLSVDGQATQPSIRSDARGQDVLRVPLPQQTSEDAVLDMVYVAELPSAGSGDWSGDHRLSGSRFDLPLKNITWQVFVPEGFSYDSFDGTLTINKNAAVSQQSHRYNLQSYEKQILETNYRNDAVAQQQQALSRELAQQGRQADARRALSIGYNFSKGNKALNEDIRVDLDNLLKQQAKVGLMNARGRLRQQISGAADNNGGMIELDGQNIIFSQQQADRMESSLGKADSENLELITQRIIQTQAAAEGSVAQLQITMPFSGKMLRFDSPLQVEPEAAMTVMFQAKRQKMQSLDPSVYCGLSLFVALLVIGGITRFVRLRWNLLHEILTPASCSALPAESAEPNDPNKPDDKVSAEELI